MELEECAIILSKAYRKYAENKLHVSADEVGKIIKIKDISDYYGAYIALFNEHARYVVYFLSSPEDFQCLADRVLETMEQDEDDLLPANDKIDAIVELTNGVTAMFYKNVKSTFKKMKYEKPVLIDNLEEATIEGGSLLGKELIYEGYSIIVGISQA